MLLLIHGDNYIESRKFYSQNIAQFKQKGIKDIVNLNGAKITLTDLIQAFESKSLFQSDKLVILENILQHRSANVKSTIFNYLSSTSLENSPHLILWESKKIPPSVLKKLNHFNQKLFKASPLIFKFLDSLGNEKSTLLKIYHQTINQESPELVYHMLLRQIRLLLKVHDNQTKLPPWQLSKLKKQLQFLSSNKLLAMHQKLLKIDYQLKTGRSVIDLNQHLELLLLKL